MDQNAGRGVVSPEDSKALADIMELAGFLHMFFHIAVGPAKVGKPNLIRYHILKMLRTQGNITLTEIAESLIVKKNALSQLIDRMVNDQLIERFHDTVDRRKILLSITPKGLTIAENFEYHFISNFRKLAESIPAAEDDKQEFLESITTIACLLRKGKDDLRKHFSNYSIESEEILNHDN